MISYHSTTSHTTRNTRLMVKGSELTAEERNAILTLRSAGLTVRGIAEATKRSVGVCSKVLSAQSKPKKSSRRGSKPKTSERDRRHIIRLVSAGDLSAAKAKAKLKLACSVRTIQRVLKSVDWLSYKKRPAEPAMMKRHKAARVAWTSEKALWDDVDWRCVVFSDEKKWNLDGPDGMRYQWTDTRRPIQPNVRRHSGGGSIMVWAGFSGVTKTELKFLTGKVNSAKYISTLRSHLQPMIDPETQVFQQDNAPCHTSRETKEWLASRNIKVMPWPAYSPDLNPIENVWGIMTQHVYAGGKQYDNLHDLQVAVQAAWDAVTSQQLDTLVQSMRHRCVKVLQLQGGYISY
jgi:transposase